jgi:tetratricopeptide (TPR) repeat protein
MARHLALGALLAAWLCGAAIVAPPASAETPADRSIRRYQRLLGRKPADADLLYRLGDAYIQKSRETGDPGYLDRAEQALRASLRIAPGRSGALRHLAYVLYQRHEFAEAATQAQRAVALDPADSHAWGVLGDARLEVGMYEEAETAYRRMLEAGGDLYSHARAAALRTVRGDPRGAIALLEQAIALGRAHGRPAESIAWTEWQLGAERFALGDLGGAERAYRDALATYPGYHRALAGLAQVRAAQGRDPEAVALYRQAIAVIPQPDYVAALGDVYARLGRADAARQQYDLVEYIGRLSALNRVLYSRELATFYLDHDRKVDAALALARRELEVRRDLYAHDLLAWALYRNGEFREARAAMQEALRHGTVDARLFYHAGLIERALGQDAEARDYLRRALETNPHFHLLHAAEARRILAELDGQPVAAAGRGGRDAL